VVCDTPPRSPDYYARLYEAIDDPAFIRSVAEYLARRDVSKFNPGARPVYSEGRAAVINATRSPLTNALQLLVKHWPGDTITSDALRNWIAAVEGVEHCMPHPAHMRRATEALGMMSVKGRVMIAIPDGTGSPQSKQHRLWIVREAKAYANEPPHLLAEIAAAAVSEAFAGNWRGNPAECPVNWENDFDAAGEYKFGGNGG
jgi:hypothetical protein